MGRLMPIGFAPEYPETAAVFTEAEVREYFGLTDEEIQCLKVQMLSRWALLRVVGQPHYHFVRFVDSPGETCTIGRFEVTDDRDPKKPVIT